MRIAAVHLPSVRIELARGCLASAGVQVARRHFLPTSRSPEARAPLAVVVARPGGAVKDERSLLGGTRLDEVSREARACGVKAGDTIAAARAKESSLLVRVVPERAVRGVLESVAEAALAFGRTASIDEASDVVCADVTGCAHLFGGEAALAAALRDRVRAMHHAARVAVADGPRVATAMARYARQERNEKGEAIVVKPGGNAAAIRLLPLRALPIDDAEIAWLAKLGLARVGDLQTLPARGLATRIGPAWSEIMALLAGDDAAPLDPYVPPVVPEERAELEYGIEQTSQLVFVVKALCDRLAARLAGRAMAATRIEIVLTLDRGISREERGEASASLPLTLPAPMATAAELLGVARARVESWTIAAPVLAVALRAPELARKEGRALDLFSPEAKAERALPRLVAELAADLGVERVGTLALGNTWRPEERTRLVPYDARGGARPDAPRGLSLESIAPEPARVIAVPLAARGFEPVRLLARVESVEWWRWGDGGSAEGAALSLLGESRDFVAAWNDSEKRMAWVAIDRERGDAVVRGWMD